MSVTDGDRLDADGQQREDERRRLAIQAGQLGIWDWDVVRDHVEWSERVYELHGVKPGEFGGTVADFARLVHPDDAPAVGAALETALQGGQSFEAEFRVQLADGRTRWLVTRAEVIRDDDGRPVRMVGSTNDVTERVELLAAERQSRAVAENARRRLELLARTGAVLSRSLEPDATLQAIASIVVPEVADWCRVDLLDATGQLRRALTYHSDPDKAREAAALAARLHVPADSEGSMAWVAANSVPHLEDFEVPRDRNPDQVTFARAIGMRSYFAVPLIARGRTLGALAAVQAESGRRFSDDDCALIAELAHRAALALDNARSYAEAEAALKEAETANRSKDEFLAMLGHELRNPLAPIMTALHVMRLKGESGGAERGIIERQVAHLSRLVDDLLDVSRITQGKIQLQRELVDMGAVVNRALELTQPALDQRRRPLDVELPGEPALVYGDSVRLVQVVCNLLTNAAKFTPGDQPIELRLRRQDGKVLVVVEDHGKGMSAELLPRVFDLFVQSEQPLDRQKGGLGLGLSIVRTLVKMHQGTVRAESAGVGRGSTFTVVLPAAGAGAALTVVAAATAPATGSGAGRILVVDDNVDAAETLAVLLGHAGYEVQSHADGPEALAAFEAFQPGLAILDIGLPSMDGYELARRLRALDSSVRLIALTGYGQERDRARALAGDFDEHMVKPVAPDRLFEMIRHLLAGRL
ncbi:MAG: PAS domain-containing protein [Acidobacteriota bacterium]|nr:PAS domain-containing protein [Acidobacteriota bacterium]